MWKRERFATGITNDQTARMTTKRSSREQCMTLWSTTETHKPRAVGTVSYPPSSSLILGHVRCVREASGNGVQRRQRVRGIMRSQHIRRSLRYWRSARADEKTSRHLAKASGKAAAGLKQEGVKTLLFLKQRGGMNDSEGF